MRGLPFAAAGLSFPAGGRMLDAVARVAEWQTRRT